MFKSGRKAAMAMGVEAKASMAIDSFSLPLKMAMRGVRPHCWRACRYGVVSLRSLTDVEADDEIASQDEQPALSKALTYTWCTVSLKTLRR